MGIIHGIALIVGPSVTSANVLDIWHEHAGQSGSKKETTHRVTEPQEQEYKLDYIGVLKGINTKRVWIKVELNGIPLKMELDTGASVSLVSKKTWREKLGSPPLTKKKNCPTSLFGA